MSCSPACRRSPLAYCGFSFRSLIRVSLLSALAMFWPAVQAAEPNQPPGPLSPEEGLARLQVFDDLEIEQVLAEPHIAQPIFMTFDERGRLWVINYLQYPFPAGLKILSEDKFLRAVYDKVPPPPPNHFVGADKITIHEDANGDGRFDSHKTFLEGLNIATSCAIASDGVWVLNPPYLLFYPDRDGDDVPDGDPEVHLEGFGIEDTHSCANSLRWGPDGWLYACQGSTVSGQVKRPGEKEAVYSMGQNVWRYHPPTRRYEIFAEGGGNAFGLELDAQARTFSGHNGGNTRGFHYVQGGYSQKGFGKHGPLSNPYAFGYFPAMRHDNVPRFTHNFVIYEGELLPERYRGRLFGVAPLQSHIVMSRVEPDGSSYRTVDEGFPVTSADTWFRPVDIKTGPDGAIYIADMYEGQIAHLRHHEGLIDKSNGRIYRLRPKGQAYQRAPDLSQKSASELIEYLSHPTKEVRQLAVRLIGERGDAKATEALRTKLVESQGQLALELLWAVQRCGGLDDATTRRALEHSDPFVRQWMVRLIGDRREVAPALARRLADLAATEPHVQVRSQLASVARRLPAEANLAIVENLLSHDADADDIHVPLLLWWSIESCCGQQREAVLRLFENSATWSRPLTRQHLLSRVMQRFALAGTRQDLLTCARLFQLAPDDDARGRLMEGFETAFKGRVLAGLPDELLAALATAGKTSLSLAIRQGDAAAIAEATAVVGDDKADPSRRLQLAAVLGEVKAPAAIPVLLEVLRTSADDQLRMTSLSALQVFNDPRIAEEVLASYAQFPPDVRDVAQTLLVSRATSARRLAEAVEAGAIDPATLPLDVVRRMTVHKDERLAELVQKHWGAVEGATTSEMQQQIERLRGAILEGAGSPYEGRKLYVANCGKCHKLFGQGGEIGPDLTAFKRDDVGNLLVNVVNPSAEIREGFETYQALTADGRVVSGFLVEKDNQLIVLRGADGQNVSLPQDDIEELLPVKKSLMPERLLNDYTEQQVRDLFAYLRSTQPLNVND